MKFRSSASTFARFMLAICWALAAAGIVCAQDFEREARWRAEIEPTVVVGDPVMLKHSVRMGAPDFFAIYTESKGSPKAGLVLLHGAGVHPDFGMIGALRVSLAEAGYATLSVQMPVQGKDAKAEDYHPKVFPNALDRIARAANYMQARGHRKLVLVSHSMGAWMANEYFDANATPPYAAWICIGITGGLSSDLVGALLKGRALPVFDVYGQHDFEVTLNAAGRRYRAIKDTGGSRQVQVPGADHYFSGKERELSAALATWLDEVSPGLRAQ